MDDLFDSGSETEDFEFSVYLLSEAEVDAFRAGPREGMGRRLGPVQRQVVKLVPGPLHRVEYSSLGGEQAQAKLGHRTDLALMCLDEWGYCVTPTARGERWSCDVQPVDDPLELEEEAELAWVNREDGSILIRGLKFGLTEAVEIPPRGLQCTLKVTICKLIFPTRCGIGQSVGANDSPPLHEEVLLETMIDILLLPDDLPTAIQVCCKANGLLPLSFFVSSSSPLPTSCHSCRHCFVAAPAWDTHCTALGCIARRAHFRPFFGGKCP